MDRLNLLSALPFLRRLPASYLSACLERCELPRSSFVSKADVDGAKVWQVSAFFFFNSVHVHFSTTTKPGSNPCLLPTRLQRNVTKALPRGSSVKCAVSIETSATACDQKWHDSMREQNRDQTMPIFFMKSDASVDDNDAFASSLSSLEPSEFDDPGACLFDCLVLHPTSSSSPPPSPALIFSFTSDRHPFALDTTMLKQIRLQRPNGSLPPCILFVFPTVLFRVYEIPEFFVSPIDDHAASMKASYERLSASFKEISQVLQSAGKALSPLTHSDLLTIISCGRPLPVNECGRSASPNASANSKQGAQLQESLGKLEDVIEIAQESDANAISGNGSQAEPTEENTSSATESAILCHDALLMKAEDFAPMAKSRRLSRERVTKLIKVALAPPTSISASMSEAQRYLPDGFIKSLARHRSRLDGSSPPASESAAASTTENSDASPTSRLSINLNECAKEFKNCRRPLSMEEDTRSVLESLNSRVALAKSALEKSINELYAAGKKSGKRKASTTQGQENQIPAPADTGKDPQMLLEEILVCTQARNMLTQ